MLKIKTMWLLVVLEAKTKFYVPMADHVSELSQKKNKHSELMFELSNT